MNLVLRIAQTAKEINFVESHYRAIEDALSGHRLMTMEYARILDENGVLIGPVDTEFGRFTPSLRSETKRRWELFKGQLWYFFESKKPPIDGMFTFKRYFAEHFALREKNTLEQLEAARAKREANPVFIQGNGGGRVSFHPAPSQCALSGSQWRDVEVANEVDEEFCSIHVASEERYRRIAA